MNVPHSDQGKGPVPDQSEVVAALQRQVTDLTNRLEKMEQLISKTKIEEIMKNNEATKPKDADDSAKAAKAEDTAAATKKNKEELGSLAECKVLHVKPGISWKHKLAEIATGKLKKYAMIVCYEGIKTADRLDNEPSPSALPINIIINSVRLDQLLQGFSQNLLPEASHVPYIAPSPFKAFVHLYDKFKSGLKDMEYTFDGQLEVTTDGVNKSSPDGPSGSSNGTSEDDPFKSQQEEIMLLRCFVQMCEEHLGSFLKVQSQVADGTLERISYQNLWYLFKPGDIIIGRGEGPDSPSSAEAYCVYCPTSSRPPQEYLAVTWDITWYQRHDMIVPQYLKGDVSQQDDFHLFSYRWRFNGSRFMPEQKLVFIKPFEGEREISELTYYPKRFCKADDPVLESLIKKGETFRSLRYGHGVYKGLNVQPQAPQFVDEEVFVDFSSGYEANVFGIEPYLEPIPLSLPFIEQEDEYGARCDKQNCWTCDINMSVSKLEMKRASDFRATGKYSLTVSAEDFANFSEDQLVMLPRILLGRQQSFDHLVIPSKTKRLLQSLVKNHGIVAESKDGSGKKSKTEIDIVKGKGNGVVIFLYGPPGVGKTCGDLGSEAVEIQRNLDQHFKLAHRWNCVLLLDEADVYLAERNIHDLDRNGIVSGLIDEAFKSRIHVALRYKSIDAPGTKKIWENILDRIELDNEKKAVKVCFDRNELLEWAESHFDDIKDKKSDGLSAATWNGRQIRNAFQTAIAVASYERIKYLEEKNVSEEEALTKKAKKYRTIQLRSKHFGTVSKVVGEFEDYLVKCRGDDADRASKSSWRKDSHEPGAPRLSAYPKPKEMLKRSEEGSRRGRGEDLSDIRSAKGRKYESHSDDDEHDGNKSRLKNEAKSKGRDEQQIDESEDDSESESTSEDE
ncbi:hypothetical protein COL26b_012392 [Colletotrichum chrysophilum]|uniref:uncharacterized protein n=1 Tax=Colletotrichum chrysophilum TaxID=1836956 RepID=UPI0023003AE8|nr:uncharacterized protein COL26b_012392 [Colletotrichum chrysophilum]KAJ0364681.1 hypothetical protein COL26b_012392 [Colletotrichum chrysophilum]